MVIAFMQQEVLHSKAHDAFNESFKSHGFDVDSELEFINKAFDRVEKFIPRKIQLGMTVFFEHLTAVMAANAFSSKLADEIDPEARAFHLWHAAEELEHKNVAFDVLTEVGGGYFTRLISGLVAPLLMSKVTKQTYARMVEIYNEPLTERNQEQLEIVAERKAKQAIEVKKFFSPGFHPNNTDDSGILKDWYESLNESKVIKQVDTELSATA